jgi:hypothetical protein
VERIASRSHDDLAIDIDASAETEERFRFRFGDFRRVHRSALIAATSRAAQRGHDQLADAADNVPTHLVADL